MQETNPYIPPSAAIPPPPEPENDQQVHINRLPVSSGTEWFGHAYSVLTKGGIGWWLLVMLIYGLISLARETIGVLAGELLGGLGFVIEILNFALEGAFIAGLMMIAHSVMQGRPLRIGEMFAGFGSRFLRLFASYLAFIIGIGIWAALCVMLFMLTSGTSNLEQAIAGNEFNWVMSAYVIFTVIIILIGMVLLCFAILFVPALIIINDVSLVQAFQYSFKGCIRNFFPMLIALVIFVISLSLITVFVAFIGLMVYSMVGSGALLLAIAAIPIALLLSAYLYAFVYSMYRSIYLEPNIAFTHNLA